MIDVVRSLTRVELHVESLSAGGSIHQQIACGSAPPALLVVLPLQTLRLTVEASLLATGGGKSLGAAFLAEFGASDLREAWGCAFSSLTILPLIVTANALVRHQQHVAEPLVLPRSSSSLRASSTNPAGSNSCRGSFFTPETPAQGDVVVPTISGPLHVVGVEKTRGASAPVAEGSIKEESDQLAFTYTLDFTVPTLPLGPHAIAFRLFFHGPSATVAGAAPSLRSSYVSEDFSLFTGSPVMIGGGQPTETSWGGAAANAFAQNNLQCLGTLVLPIELSSVLACAARSLCVQPHRVIIEVGVRNTSNKTIAIDSVQLDLKSTWIGECKGSLENVPSLPEQKIAPKAIDIAGVELLEQSVILSPLNVNDSTPILQPCEAYSFLFSISLKPHLVHLTQRQSLASELAPFIKNNGSSSSSGGEASYRAIKEVLAETFVSTIYVQYSAMVSSPSLSHDSDEAALGGVGNSVSEFEKETTVVWSFANAPTMQEEGGGGKF